MITGFILLTLCCNGLVNTFQKASALLSSSPTSPSFAILSIKHKHRNIFKTKIIDVINDQSPIIQSLSLSSFGDNINSPITPDKRPAPQGGDMAYTRANIIRQMDHYISIRDIGGLDAINDVYARDGSTNTWWFVGKVARCTGTVSLERAIQRQWNLIEEHATRLRPVELGRLFGELELWTALGDSELHISNQIANYKMERISRFQDSQANDNGVSIVKCDERIVKNVEVGFNCEVVTNNGEGFRVERNNDGSPIF